MQSGPISGSAGCAGCASAVPSRIAGFSAYFVELAPASQADLISRTELNL